MSIVTAQMVLHMGIPVNDLERSVEFYTNVLGLTGFFNGSRPNAPVRLYAGDNPTPGQQVILFKRPKPIQRDCTAEDGINHQAFVVSSEDYDKAVEKFKEMGILQSAGVHGFRDDEPNAPKDQQPHRTLEFLDPDGNRLQLSDCAED